MITFIDQLGFLYYLISMIYVITGFDSFIYYVNVQCVVIIFIPCYHLSFLSL